MSRRLLTILSVASLLVSAWLMAVLLFTLSRVNPAAVPFWIGVMLGFFVLGAGSMVLVRFPAWPRAARIASTFVAGVAILFGLLVIFQNEVQARRGGDWEVYMTMIGLVAIANGIAVIVFQLGHLRSFPD
ncbi:MAG: hypothetical protein HY976_00380 [Candidatus Kerfeldbacteria bacterium]|nr:hypothetical protein [Candidatus Kerfeldbacteria bacterium]